MKVIAKETTKLKKLSVPTNIAKVKMQKKKKKTILSTIKILRKALLEKDGVQLSD